MNFSDTFTVRNCVKIDIVLTIYSCLLKKDAFIEPNS